MANRGATAVQLPSGAWRAVAYLGKDKAGKRIRKSFTANTKAEAEDMARLCELTNRKHYVIEDKDINVGTAVDAYIMKKTDDISRKKISPTTVTAYKSIRNAMIEDIENIQCLKITDDILQDWIDTLNEDHSAKTCKNAYSLVRASLYEVLPRSTVLDWKIELPSISKKAVRVPTEKDIFALLGYLKKKSRDTYIACILSAFGTLRRSEVCAITAEDVDRKNNIISVNKALVKDINGAWIVKSTKTEGSTRDIVMPASIIKLLAKEGNLVNLTPQRLSKNFIKACHALGIEGLVFHDLRHYSASIMHALGANNEYVMKRGGWTTEATLNQHYRGTISEYEKRYNDLLTDHIENTFKLNA